MNFEIGGKGVSSRKESERSTTGTTIRKKTSRKTKSTFLLNKVMNDLEKVFYGP